MMLLADAVPTGPQVSSSMYVLMWISGLLMNLATVGMFFMMTRKQRREVSFSPEAVNKREFEAHLAENKLAHDRFDVRIGGVDRKSKEHADQAAEKLRSERREDLRSLHTEINEVGKKVAGLERETQNQNDWLGRMDKKLDDLKKDSK